MGVGETGTAYEIGRGYPTAERQEQTKNPKTEYEIEPSPSGTEIELDSVTLELVSEIDEMKLEPMVESVDTTLENPTDVEIDAALGAPELYESYELPMNDMELLLAELDATSLEIQVEANPKLESAENAERPL